MPNRETISQVIPGERRTMTTLDSSPNSRIRRTAPPQAQPEEGPEKPTESEQLQPRASLFSSINLGSDDLLLLLLIILLRDEGYDSDILFLLLIWLFVDGLWV